MHFALNMMEFAFKLMNFVFKMMNFVFAMMTFVFKMMILTGIGLSIFGGFCMSSVDEYVEGVLQPNCSNAGKIMLIIGLAALIPVGLIINFSIAWWKVVAGEQRQDTGRRCGRRFARSLGIGENTTSGNAYLSYLFITVGSVLLSVGWAGLVGTLAGQRTGLEKGYILPHNGLMLTLLGSGSLAFSLGMLVAQFFVTGEDEKTDIVLLTQFYPKLWKHPAWFFGLYFFVVSTKMCSVSFACFADNLAGVSMTVKTWPRVAEVPFGGPTLTENTQPADWDVDLDGDWPDDERVVDNPVYYQRLEANCNAHAYCQAFNKTCYDVQDLMVVARQNVMKANTVEESLDCIEINHGKWLHPTESNECPQPFAIILISIFAPLWFASFILMITAWYKSLGVAAKDKWRRTYARTISKPSFRVGIFLLVGGIVAGSVGGACMNNTLAGVEDCRAEGFVLLYVGFATGFTGMLAMKITEMAFHQYEDYDDEKKMDVDKQTQMLCVMELAVPFFTWGVACTSRGPDLYYTCGPTDVWGGLILLMIPSWALGLGAGMYIKWNSICGGCVQGLDTIIMDPRQAPVVVLRAVAVREKQWKNYKAQNPGTNNYVNQGNACCDGCCQKVTNFVLGCVDNRYFCARWLLSNYIPPPEEDDATAAPGAVALDEVSISGFGDDSDDEGGSFAALVKGMKLQLVPDWDASPPRRKCCCTVMPRQHPAAARHFWMTERPLELRWAERRGTFFTRARVTGCREDVARWADEIAAMRDLADKIETKPFGPPKPAEDEKVSAWRQMMLDAQTPTQADINEEQRLRRQQLDEIAENIDVLEQFQARSFTVHTEQKGDVQIMAATDATREMWVETLQGMIAETEAAAELQDQDGGDEDEEDDDDGDGDDEIDGAPSGPMADWLSENGLITAADVIEDYGPFTLEQLKNLKRREVIALGMDDELNDNEMAALESALEWPPEEKRKKSGDYPKGRVVIKVQVRGSAAGSGLQYSVKEARVSHRKLEPNDNGDVELCENIAEQITTDEAMSDKYLPMAAEKISLALDYALDNGSTGKPADGTADANHPVGASSESAVAQAKSEHDRIMAGYDAVKAAIAEAEEEPDQADEVETPSAKLEALMTHQEHAKVKMEQAEAWHSAETEHAAAKVEVGEVEKLVAEAVVAEGEENPHQGRLDALKQAGKDAAEKLKDAREAHGEPDGGGAAVEAGERVGDEAAAVGDSWTMMLMLPGDAGDDWEKTTGHGEKACAAVEGAVAGALGLAADAVEVVAVLEYTSKLKKKMEKERRKILAKRKAARVAFFGVDEEEEDKENGNPQVSTSNLPHLSDSQFLEGF